MTAFPAAFSIAHRMVVRAENDSSITVGYAGDPDERTFALVRNALGANETKTVSFVEIPESELLLAVSAIERPGMGVRGQGTGAGIYELSSISAGAPVATVLNALFLEARAQGSSDIHLERGRGGMTIRLRVDGVLRTARTFDAETGAAIAARIKLMANLNTLECRRPQDGRFTVTSSGTDQDVRVSTVPSAGGESIVLRILGDEEGNLPLERLGFSPAVYRALSAIPETARGLVLVTGPTGSGKTTTLSALVRRCSPETRKIVSIEDPVEYRIPGVTQIQTNEELGLGFAELLRRILRQDPDVIMIGEIRDGETARLASRAALTGHLVLSTLHTGSAREAPARLEDLGVAPWLVTEVLEAVIGQRLVRRRCPSCGQDGDSTPGAPDTRTARKMDIVCRACGGTGYSGRIPVAEVILPRGKKKRDRGLNEAAARLVASGITDEAEILRILGESA